MLGWAIPESDLRATVDALAGRGVEVLRFEDFEQGDCGIRAARGRDRVVWFSDPDGNMLSLSSHAVVHIASTAGRDWAGHRSELEELLAAESSKPAQRGARPMPMCAATATLLAGNGAVLHASPSGRIDRTGDPHE